MRFILIDKIKTIEPGASIRTVKNVSLAEEYLADHFPAFPVLPGVLMLEGIIESASWLVRISENFAHSMVLLEQARNVRYKSFLAPAGQIEYDIQVKALEENVSSFTGKGFCGDTVVVEAKIALRHFNLADSDPAKAGLDAQIIEALKQRLKLIKGA